MNALSSIVLGVRIHEGVRRRGPIKDERLDGRREVAHRQEVTKALESIIEIMVDAMDEQ